MTIMVMAVSYTHLDVYKRQELEMTTEKGGSVWRSGLYNPQQVVSGNMGYGSDGLSLYGTEPVTVEYFLGTDLDVEKVAFTFISPEFFSGEDFYYIRPFEGEACFYNNETKNYDPVDLSGGGFTESVLAPYPVSYTHLDVYKRQGLHQDGILTVPGRRLLLLCEGGAEDHRLPAGCEGTPDLFEKIFQTRKIQLNK